MFWALAAFTTIAMLGLALFAIGTTLPSEHVATVRARYAASPTAVWAIIGNPLAAGSWRKDIRTIEQLPDREGQKAWKEVSRSGSVTYVLVESTPERGLITRIADDSLPFGGQWEFSLRPAGTGAELTISERGFVKPPFFRVMARYVFGYTLSMVAYHDALATKLGEQVSPEIVADGR
jgi:hypothetical protein